MQSARMKKTFTNGGFLLYCGNFKAFVFCIGIKNSVKQLPVSLIFICFINWVYMVYLNSFMVN